MVDEAVEKKPFSPKTVVVELYPVLTVNGKAKVEYAVSREQETPLQVKSPKSSLFSIAAVTLSTVRAELERVRPGPVRSLNDSPAIFRLVVEAVMNDEYMVLEEYGKVRRP
jgi:hypothetical protein